MKEDYGYEQKIEPIEPLFGIKQMGTTAALMGNEVDPVANLKAQIFSGAGSIEICAFGTGQAQASQSPSFESIQSDQRQAIRELIRVNKVDVRTHAAPSINLAGYNARQQEFSDEILALNFNELKKAIDFAAEAANGGSVVVHAGEFPRPLGNDAPKQWKEDWKGDTKWREYDGEENKSRYFMANKETGKIAAIEDEMKVVVPVYKKDAKGKYEYVTDEDGNPIVDEMVRRVLLKDSFYSKKFGEKFDDYPDEVKALAFLKKLEQDGSDFKTNTITFAQYRKERLENLTNELDKKGIQYDPNELFTTVLKDFHRERVNAQVQQNLAQMGDQEEEYKNLLKQRDDILKEFKFYKSLQEKMSDEDWELQKKSIQTRKSILGGESGVEQKDPLQLLTMELGRNERQLKIFGERVAGFKAEAEKQLDDVSNYQDIATVGLERTTKTLVDAAMYAMAKSKEWAPKRANDNFQDIQINVENIFPTMGGQDYGSHPDELMHIIDKARDAFAKKLVDTHKASDMKEAKVLAERHIGATLDTGHLNVWKKHLQRNDNESQEDFDDRFKEWYTEKVETMAKGNYLGNVHLADNFGYDDVHLTIGEGNAPIQAVLDILKKHKYGKKIEAEGGWGPGQMKGMKGAWRAANVNIYRQGTENWTNPTTRIYQTTENPSYHTNINKPFFMFRGYAPDNEGFRPWSGLGLE